MVFSSTVTTEWSAKSLKVGPKIFLREEKDFGARDFFQKIPPVRPF